MSYVLGTVVTTEAQREAMRIDAAARAAAGPMPTTPPAAGMRWALIMEQRVGGKGTGVTGPYTWQQIGGRQAEPQPFSMPPPPPTGAEPPGAPADPIVEQKEREAAAYCKGRKTGLLIAAGVLVAWRVLR